MPKLQRYFIIGGVIIGIALTPVVLPHTLGLLGFGTAGPVTGEQVLSSADDGF